LVGLDPLIILSPDGKKEIMRVTADGNGKYRATLPPGDYRWMSKTAGVGMSAPPQPFTILANQTGHVDMAIDTGFR
jgi:hypothetical protein